MAHLWLFVPIYGWARYFAIAAWISKLGFDELVDSTNIPAKKQYFSLASLLIFLVSGLISTIVPLLLGYLATVVVFLIVEAVREIMGLFFAWSEYDLFDTANAIYPAIAVAIFLIFVLFSVWFYAKTLVSDLTFIDTSKRRLFYLYNRSRLLTKNRQLEIFGIILLSFVISIPVWIVGLVIYLGLVILSAIGAAVFSTDIVSANEDITISICLTLGLLCAHAFLVPFWQSVKAVTFYRLTELDRRYSLR